MEERTLLEEGGVLVANARIVIGGTTYAVANITSMSKAVQKPGASGLMPVTIVIGAVLLLLGAQQVVDQDWTAAFG